MNFTVPWFFVGLGVGFLSMCLWIWTAPLRRAFWRRLNEEVKRP